MTQAVQLYDTSVIALFAVDTENIDAVEQLALLKSKFHHPVFAGVNQRFARARLLVRIQELEIELCWSSHEKPETPSGKLFPIRRR